MCIWSIFVIFFLPKFLYILPFSLNRSLHDNNDITLHQKYQEGDNKANLITVDEEIAANEDDVSSHLLKKKLSNNEK